MDKSKLKRFIKLVEGTEKWDVCVKEGYIYLSVKNVSENYEIEISLECTFTDFMKNVMEEYESYDVDDHVQFWAVERDNNPNYGIPAISVLFREAHVIDDAWESLYYKVLST